MHPFWLLVGLLIVPLLLRRAVLARYRQTRILRDYARKKRLNFVAEDSIGIVARYDRLDLIRQGHNRSATHLLYGSNDAGSITLFNYTYELGFGINRMQRRWWVAVVETHAEGVTAFKQCDGRAPLLQSTAQNYLCEVSGPLVAVAMPDSSGLTDEAGLIALDRLLETARQLALQLST